jgi:hypothetical protein
VLLVTNRRPRDLPGGSLNGRDDGGRAGTEEI